MPVITLRNLEIDFETWRANHEQWDLELTEVQVRLEDGTELPIQSLRTAQEGEKFIYILEVDAP